jgi:NAD(P)-dependent dehydrogenase (short-subunit alcohol dehydrogenase family)
MITGCSRGIGLRTALRFAQEGHRVFATMRDLALADDLATQAKDRGLELDIAQLDVCDGASVERAVARAVSSDGPIDVLVNNAAVGWMGPLEEDDLQEARLVFETNFFGPMQLIQCVLPAMRERRSGTIVNVTSTAGRLPEPYNGVYAASKHALEALSESLHYELSPFDIRVVIVEPGAHDTRGYHAARAPERFASDSPHEPFRRRFSEEILKLPVARPGDPQDVADAIHRATCEENPKLRHPVGEGAEEILALRRRLDDEEWERTMRTTFDIWD